MDTNYSTRNEPATPDYVLAVIQDMHRQASHFDPAVDRDAKLSFATTVAKWREACDLLGWRELGRAENEIWGISCSDAEWHAVFEPADQRYLSDVCRLIASRAVRQTIRPARMLGRECVAAGAFLTIKTVLRQVCAEADDIRPSTPLAPFARRYSHLFLGPISRLAPGKLPPVVFRSPVYDAANWGIIVSAAMLTLGIIFTAMFSNGYWLTIVGVLVFVACYALTWYSARCMLPASVRFGELRTFRDLAIVVSQSTTTRDDAL